jgi:excisionase family DNA binding protein
MDVLTVRQTAQALKVSYMTVYKMIRNGTLKAFQLSGKGSSWRVQTSDLNEFVKSRMEVRDENMAGNE